MLNQTFPIIYQGKQYLVDPSCLIESSRKFKEIITPYINQGYNIKSLHLKITCDAFSSRNINNFLRICQNLETDVQNSEMYEICEISSMFQADEIFNKGITFVHDRMDRNYNVCEGKYQKKDYLKIEPEESSFIHQRFNLSDFDFDYSYQDSQIKDEESMVAEEEDDIARSHRENSICYQIKIEKPLMKCRRFLFYSDDRLLFSAKQKINQIFIAEGKNIHINDKQIKKKATITQNRRGYNVIRTEEQDIKIKYLRTNPNDFKKSFSLKISFLHGNSLVSWIPKFLKNNEKLNGSFNHHPLHSKKNIILQNRSKNTTFIIRKMSKNGYEAECHSSLSPLIAFSIAISQIVGPYLI